MSNLKLILCDNAFFRKCYILTLFFLNIAFIKIPANVALVMLFVWGVILTAYNEKKYHTFLNMRFGIWIVAFMLCSVVTAIYHISNNFVGNLVMILHTYICFFTFYGMHTEKHHNPQSELYSVCRFVVYISTICALAGLILLMAGVSFEIYGLKFIIFENRFTGVYTNPNLLGFSAVCALFCCHMLTKKNFIRNSGQTRVSRIWLAGCATTNIISLLLCDSNASLVLCICYCIGYTAFKLLASERHFTVKQIIQKSAALLLVGTIIVFSAFTVRKFCQAGFSVLLLQSKQQTTSQNISNEDIQEIASEITTFTHQNKNIDSGRFGLIKDSAELFKLHPLLGIGKSNIVDYSQRYLENTVLNYANFSDLHNGYLTILVCSGIFGFTLFSIFGIRFAKHIFTITFLHRRYLNNSSLPCEVCFLLAYLVYALFEKTLLYDLSFMVMFFWMIAGSASCILRKYEKGETPQNLFYQKRLKAYKEKKKLKNK